MERSNLDKFLFWLTIVSGISFLITFIFLDYLPEWLWALTIVGILVRVDAMILDTKLPIYLKILTPLVILSVPIISFLAELSPSEPILIMQILASFVIAPLFFVCHLLLLIIYAKKQNNLSETIRQFLVILAIIAISLLLGIGLSYI